MDKQEIFPDGTVIDKWFYDIKIPELSDLGKQYVLTDYNILDDGKIHTKEIQNLIDRAYENGGGVIVVPKGTYLTPFCCQNGCDNAGYYIIKTEMLQEDISPCLSSKP